MQNGNLSVGTTAVKVPVDTSKGVPNGLRLLGRAAAAGNVFIGTSNAVTTSTGELLQCGDPATSSKYTVPRDHLASGGEIWLIASQAAQTVDWCAG